MTYPLKERLNAPLEQQEPRRPTGTDRRILDAATEVFARNGFQGAKTLEIARTAGVSEKTLFQHFKNKEQLFVETIHPTLLDILDPLVKLSCEESHESAIADAKDKEPLSSQQMPGTLKDRMHAVALERIHFARENPDMLKLTLQELLIRDEYRDAVTGLWMDQLAPIISASIEAGIDSGEIRELPIPTVMRVIVPVLSAYATIRSLLAPEGDWNDEREVDLMLDILFNGLIPRKGNAEDTQSH